MTHFFPSVGSRPARDPDCIHCMRSDVKHGVIGILLLLLLSTSVAAQSADSVWIEGMPLQVKLDRLYLGNGLEARIYPDCRFVVHQGYDSIYTGCIETSYPGVSVSYSTDGFFDTLRLADLHIWMERAPIDTLSPITIGHVGYLPLPPVDATADSADTSRIVIRRHQSQFEVSLAFEEHALDGFFSYRKYGPGGEFTITTGQPAPFFVALVPNPSRSITYNGFLTTSLYYRLDPQRLPMYFDGDGLIEFNRCCLGGETAPRPYPYGPVQGRALLESFRDYSRNVVIGVEHPMFESAAGYFADILSRDRFKTAVTRHEADADICLIAVPLGDSEISSLRYLHQRLVADTIPGSSPNQTLRIIGNYLESAELAFDSTIRAHYLRLAESSLREDLGVFALFRPTLYFTARLNLLGNVFTPDSNIDFSGLTKARLPQKREDCGP